MKAGLKVLSSILAFSLIQAGSLFCSQQYQLIDLGLQQYQSSRVTGINDKGWVTGVLEDGGYEYIFAIDEDKTLATRYEKMHFAEPVINNSNEIFGSIITWKNAGNLSWEVDTVYKWENPFQYFQYFNFHHLERPSLPWTWDHGLESREAIVWDVNDLGQILVMNSASSTQAEDIRHENKIWVYEGDDFQRIEEKNFTAGYTINNASQILGSTVTTSEIDKTTMEKASVYNYKDKSLYIFDFPDRSWGNDMNDHGLVVGGFFDPQDKVSKGFLADLSGQITHLNNFEPDCISDQGEIFGTYISGDKEDQVAIWKEGEFTDLKDVVSLVDDNGNRWDSIDEIIQSNTNGYLIGNGTIQGKTHGFILKPMLQ